MWLTLLETGLPFTPREVSIKPGTKAPEFTALYKTALGADPASDGKVPVLVDDGSVLTESAVVADYLASKAGGALLPSTPLERVRTALFVEQQLGKFVPAFYGLLMAPVEAREAKMAAFLEAVRATGVVLGACGGPYLLGSKVSIGDLLLYPFVERMCVLRHYRWLVLPTEGAGWAEFAAYVAAMEARESAVKTKQDPQLFITAYESYANPSPLK